MSLAGPTPHPQVNEILKHLLINVKTRLRDQFVGMFLYGSLSSGDFNPETSDVDVLVITEDTLAEPLIMELEAMHESIWAGGHPFASRLEGAYIPRRAIRRHHPDDGPYPTVNEHRFYLDRPGSDWIIQRHVVREFGIVLEGPDPRSLIDPVSPDDIRAAVRGVLNEWWFPMLEDPSWLRGHGSNYHGFAVITMCRALHALESGVIVSKPAAVEWARQKLGDAWSNVLDAAVAFQHEPNAGLLKEALNLIRYVQAHIPSHGDPPSEGQVEDAESPS